MKQAQPILGKNGTLLFLVLISAFPPLTTDLYLPALPQMVDTLNTNQTMVNLTLSIYFATYAFGLLFWGPLSDKFGRKPILNVGFLIYIAASLWCATVNQVEHLIVARLLQAFGGSAVTVVATAIVKDLFEGRERERIMATIMSLVIIAPMVAPVLGAFLLKVSTWHMMFIVLAVFGSLCAVFSWFYRETLQVKSNTSIVRSWGRLFHVLKNPKFLSLLGVFSLTTPALMAFLAAGSYIYVENFGLSEQTFSYFFAFNAFIASFGPRLYIKLSKTIATELIIRVCFTLLCICGVLTIVAGHLSPYLFAIFAALATFSTIATRIPGTNLMLEQQDKDTGSAAAIIQFCSMMCGAFGMMLVSIRPESLIVNLGMIQLITGVIAGGLWLIIRHKDYVVEALNKFKS